MGFLKVLKRRKKKDLMISKDENRYGESVADLAALSSLSLPMSESLDSFSFKPVVTSKSSNSSSDQTNQETTANIAINNEDNTLQMKVENQPPIVAQTDQKVIIDSENLRGLLEKMAEGESKRIESDADEDSAHGDRNSISNEASTCISCDSEGTLKAFYRYLTCSEHLSTFAIIDEESTIGSYTDADTYDTTEEDDKVVQKDEKQDRSNDRKKDKLATAKTTMKNDNTQKDERVFSFLDIICSPTRRG